MITRTSVDFTVAIPTYNGSSRLPLMLERLRSQTHTEQISWEIIVVDNNSTDDTAKVVQSYQAEWSGVPLRYCLETEQGAAFARQRGVREANGEFVGLLDDDNLPALDWVASAYLFGKEHPQAGAYGSQIHGQFEVAPPENFQKIAAFLAITERGSQAQLYEPERLSLPPGAGLVVRKQAWCETVPSRPMLKGRVGKSMVGGEDLEPLVYIHQAGWEIWYNPAMQTYHQIPSCRLERSYLISLAHSAGLNLCHLRMINQKAWQKPIVFTKLLLGGFRRVFLHFLKYRKVLKEDLIAACEMAFFLGGFLSPFYFLRSSFLKQ